MPFIAISLKKNKLNVVDEICEKKKVKGLMDIVTYFMLISI